MNRITKEPWVGKRRIGWGFNPITWQGWVLTLILVLILVLDSMYFYKTIFFWVILIIAIICFILVALITSEYLSYPQDEEEFI